MPEPSPLDIMLTAMRRKWRDGDEDGAVALAKAAAPYIHPKAAVAHLINDLAQVTDDDLDELFARGRAGSADGGADLFD